MKRTFIILGLVLSLGLSQNMQAQPDLKTRIKSTAQRFVDSAAPVAKTTLLLSLGGFFTLRAIKKIHKLNGVFAPTTEETATDTPAQTTNKKALEVGREKFVLPMLVALFTFGVDQL
jgi:hypothetical protein